MVDISMCNNEKCPLKNNCFRYLATPNKFAQSYILIEDCNNCTHWWPVTDDKELQDLNRMWRD